MRALEVSVDGQRNCLTGVGGDGLLQALVQWARDPGPGEELTLRVGGLDRVTGDSLRWASPPLGVGSEVRVRVVEAAEAEPPADRTRRGDEAGAASSSTGGRLQPAGRLVVWRGSVEVTSWQNRSGVSEPVFSRQRSSALTRHDWTRSDDTGRSGMSPVW